MLLDRQQSVTRVFDENDRWDIIIIGGGATGLGAAVDAASRGYRCVLFEQSDFGKATSSRSSKLVHGGVRYLRQGRIGLVTEALRERSILRRNAPHVVRRLPLIIPNYRRWDSLYFGVGMALYDSLGGPHDFGRSRSITQQEVLNRAPMLRPDNLRGGVLFFDGQFDDARLLINLAQTAAGCGAAVLNYVPVLRTIRGSDGLVCGVLVRELESGREKEVVGRCVINATGAFCDAMRQLDEPQALPIVTASQGTHLVLERRFLPGNTAILLPRTNDGRLVFAIPWHDHVLLGTTDTPVDQIALEPRPFAVEIDYLLDTAAWYFTTPPARSDVLSAFAGIRPLVKSPGRKKSADLSREHAIDVSRSGLISITGGKWTTYRAMAQECIDLAISIARLPRRRCVTAGLRLHGFDPQSERFGPLACYGQDATAILEMIKCESKDRLEPDFPLYAAQVRWATRHEAARTVEDVLARRTRALHLNCRAAMRLAPAVARVMADELGRDESWREQQIEQFRALASNYFAA